MPRTAPTGLLAELKKQERHAPITLVDIELNDGTRHFWSDHAITTTAKIGGASQTYKPWIKSVGVFRRSKSMATDAGDIVVQNLSGNLIDRDVAKAMRDKEFEGALAIVRFMLPLSQIVYDEYHGTLSEQSSNELEASFRHLQLLDTSQRQIPDRDYSVACSLRFKSQSCGSTGSATTCPKTLTACQDASRAAQERFNGITMTPSESVADVQVRGSGGGTRKDPNDPAEDFPHRIG